MMRRLFSPFVILLAFVAALLLPITALAAGIGASGGGSYTVGSSFTVYVVASGASFDAFHGVISVAGPVTVNSISPGSAIWANSPTVGGSFDGALSSATTSFTIATLRLTGKSVGSGYVSVSSVRLVRNGVQISSTGGSTGFTIVRAPTPSGAVTVTSSTNPDQTQTYGVTTVQLAWSAPANGATGYSTVFDQAKDTTPPTTVTTTATTASYDNLNLGTYYFHIRAQNADGWGPTTNFQVNIGRSTNTALQAPTITTVSKDGTFVNDVSAGTVTGFTITGTSTGLIGYTVTLGFTPGTGIPAAQALTALIQTDGSWSVLFDQAIPAGFYKVTAVATQDKVTTPTSQPVNIELSVANGGTAKIITNDDLPKPDLTVHVAGMVFADHAHFRRAEEIAIALVAGVALIVFLASWGVPFLVRRLRARRHNKDSKKDLPKPPARQLGL